MFSEINKTDICVEDRKCFETYPVGVECIGANPAPSISTFNLTDSHLDQIRYDFDSDDSIVDPHFFADIESSSDESDDQVAGKIGNTLNSYYLK